MRVLGGSLNAFAGECQRLAGRAPAACDLALSDLHRVIDRLPEQASFRERVFIRCVVTRLLARFAIGRGGRDAFFRTTFTAWLSTDALSDAWRREIQQLISTWSGYDADRSVRERSRATTRGRVRHQ